MSQLRPTIRPLAMPSVHDLAHDVFCVHLAIDQSKTGANGVVYQGRRHGLSSVHHIQNHTLLGHSPPASQAGRRVASRLAFGLIGPT